jgi:hypothetical protein
VRKESPDEWDRKQAAFYRGYLPDDRSLVPLTVLLSTTVALWLLVYLICFAGDAPQYAASFDPQGRTCPHEIDPQTNKRADLSVMLGPSGALRVASTGDGSPVNTETTQ